MDKQCKDIDHIWYVFSTTPEDRCLLLECHRCKAFGIVSDPGKQEWKDAADASLNPYLWKDNSRVIMWPPGN